MLVVAISRSLVATVRPLPLYLALGRPGRVGSVDERLEVRNSFIKVMGGTLGIIKLQGGTLGIMKLQGGTLGIIIYWVVVQSFRKVLGGISVISN